MLRFPRPWLSVAWLVASATFYAVGCGSSFSNATSGDDGGAPDATATDAASAESGVDSSSDGAREATTSDGGFIEGGGGSGDSGTCEDAATCPPTDDECVVPACMQALCITTDAPSGTALTGDIPGDCQENVCNGSGGKTTEPNDNDPPHSLNPCVTFTCAAGAPTLSPVPPGLGCQGGFCDGMGHCAQCTTMAGCASIVGSVCMGERCVPAHCDDGVMDATETGVDCGSVCNPCASGGGCNAATDCTSGVCTSHTCAAPSCTDNVKNGTEGDVDCGGSCVPCGPGKTCNLPADCRGGDCDEGTCVSDCSDDVKNGAETGIDCGGAICPACAVGGGCLIDSDCLTKRCSGAHICF